ncbi:uncharacterized protein TM35_000062790 [Trypanosoma theileri]|uniref:Uncharacterized protein n=1 Tax=Trypanosoma theileri TaxID=67003 RepID=A0A1X0P2V7_9TRYP|nr:uncharacterized protein TM35_000062790 [Trypanosoma theileri]ORC91274.1 hypothetical protein TM35_000062790 [Trypanosoma theileri]
MQKRESKYNKKTFPHKNIFPHKNTFPIRTFRPIRTFPHKKTLRPIGILVCWDPTTTMCEVCLAFPWEMEVRKLGAAIGQPSLPKASRGSLQRSSAPTPRCWQKKKLRGVRHPGFQRHNGSPY